MNNLKDCRKIYNKNSTFLWNDHNVRVAIKAAYGFAENKPTRYVLRVGKGKSSFTVLVSHSFLSNSKNFKPLKVKTMYEGFTK